MSGIPGLALVAVLIAANGVFVAAQFALVSVRRPMMEELAAGGNRRARAVVRELEDLSFSFSAAQFGITVTSLLVGFLAERTIGDTLVRPVMDLVGLPEQAALAVAVAGAFILAAIVQMVVGELFPKNLAIARPVGVALAVTPLARGFGIVFGPVIRIFHGSAELITERLFRIEVRDRFDGGRSLDELARIIAASGQEGSLTDEQTELLQRAVELGDRRVSEAMVPRPDVVWLAATDTLSDLRTAARTTGHSRFPVRGASDDEVLGTVHIKGLLGVPLERHDTTPVADVVDTMLAVPESEPLRRLLTDLRREQRTFAVAIDEYGGTAGIITLEDVLEELVGDIEDEFDRAGHLVRRVGSARHLIGASLRTDRVEALFGVGLPEGEYETVAGFVLDRLGHIPEPGERVEHDGLEITVTRMEGVRITEVAIEQGAPGAPAGAPASGP